MNELKARIKSLMNRVRQRAPLPPSSDVVNAAFAGLGISDGFMSPDQILEEFNRLLREVWIETLHILETFEERSYATGIPQELIREFPVDVRAAEETSRKQGFSAGVTQLFASWYPALRECFLSVSQSRKQRGGKDFELQIQRLLDLARVPYEAQESKNRTDLVLPDVAMHEENRRISMIVSVKRTLRERWQQVAEELFNLRSPNVFLFTADEEVTERHVAKISDQYNIQLVVWDQVKAEKFPSRSGVLSYTDWATKELPMLRARWHRRHG